MEKISYVTKKKGRIERPVVVYPFTYVNPYTVIPPIAAEYLQAGIAATGRHVPLFDMRFESDISEDLKAADLVCLFGHFEDCSIFGKWKFHVIPEILALIPDGVPVVAGGTGFKDSEEALKQYPKVDVIIRGNPEIPMMELLDKGSPEGIKNLVYRKGEGIIANERVIHNLPEDIYPRRDLRNPRYDYHAVGIKLDLVRAAVGCNYKCRFCYQYGKDFDGNFIRWHGRSAQSLLEEIKTIDAPILGWVDDDMTTDMNMLDELAGLLLDNGIKKLYGGSGRIDHVIKKDVSTLKKLERSGLLALSFGVESLKPETLKFYKKGLNLENTERAMRMMEKTNILLICNFILGSPGETEEDMMKFLWFGKKWNVDSLVTNRFRMQEGSEMHDLIYDENGKVRPGMERIEGKELARIKYRVKFAQRTPTRILLSLLKLYRHEGMFMDPLYLLCSALETMTRHTWLEKTWIFPASLRAVKRLVLYPSVRWVTRTAAVISTPFVKALDRLFELVDRPLGISTALLPRFFLYLKDGMYKRQRVHAQEVARGKQSD